MCTAISLQGKNHYFGRNLDLEFHYKECVTVTPRNYSFNFRRAGQQCTHYAMIGMATISQNYPLYYDATNEYGLSMAGLNFPGNAVYQPENANAENIAPFEMIAWILGQCKTVEEASVLLERLNTVNIDFSIEYPQSPLHWFIADSKRSLAVEPMKNGLMIHNNPVGVLTNNPPFDYHLHNIENYLNLTADVPTNRFSSKIDLHPSSRGMGAIGLPGDLSSASRFVRAAFTKLNSNCDCNEHSGVSQFFHILDSVAQTEGCAKVGNGFEKTIYSSCCNTELGIYYYKTYNNNQITAINMYHEYLDGKELVTFPLRCEQNIFHEN